MKRRTILVTFLAAAALLWGCGGGQKARQAQSVVDSPDIHYKRGKTLLGQDKVADAMFAFKQAESLDPEYAPAQEGMAWVYLAQNDLENARIAAEKSLDLDGKWVLARVAKARVLSREGNSEDAIDEAKKAVKDVKDSSVPDKKGASVEAHLALGDIYKEAEMYLDAQSTYQKVLEIDNLNTKADRAIKDLAAYQAAVAGQSPELKKIAAQKSITRSDVAVLFVSELPLGKIFRETPSSDQVAFRPPSQGVMGTKPDGTPASAVPGDVGDNHWARSFIGEALEKGAMEPYPDGTFKPDEPVNRAEFARLMQRFMVRYWNDPAMETQFIGTTSPYSDVNNTSPIFNAVMVVSSRNLMPGFDNGTFRPLGPVSGQEALSVIRKLKADL